MKNIKQEDLASGKVVQNHRGTFWFKGPGNNVDANGYPIEKNLHNRFGPAMAFPGGFESYYIDGKSISKEEFDNQGLPFDIASGKVVQNEHGTFYFKEPGNNVDANGYPIEENLYRENGPAVILKDGDEFFYIDGARHEECGEVGYEEGIFGNHIKITPIRPCKPCK